MDRSIAPAFNQVEKVEFLAVQKTTLTNGIPVQVINGGSQEIVKIDFIFNAGLYAQNKPLLASATNKLLKEGTKNYSAYEVAEGIDNYGAFLEVGNSFDTAHLSLYTLTKHLEKVLPFVTEVISCPSFRQTEIDTYIANAKEKFKINLEKVSFVGRQEFSNLLYGNGPYSSVVRIEDFDQLKRQDLIAFHESNYNLGNANIIVSGLVDDAVINLLDTFIGNQTIHMAKNAEDQGLSAPNENKKHLFKENALQSAIRIGRLVPNKLHPDYFGLKVLNTVLGGYFGSRLMSNIREDKGYTYGIGSGLVSMVNSGYFFISTEVQADVTKDALKEIYKEIEILRTALISDGELSLVKNYMLGQLLNACDGPFRMASLYEEIERYNLNMDYYNQYIAVIKKITPEELRSLGVKYFNPTDLKEVVVGKP